MYVNSNSVALIVLNSSKRAGVEMVTTKVRNGWDGGWVGGGGGVW